MNKLLIFVNYSLRSNNRVEKLNMALFAQKTKGDVRVGAGWQMEGLTVQSRGVDSHDTS